ESFAQLMTHRQRDTRPLVHPQPRRRPRVHHPGEVCGAEGVVFSTVEDGPVFSRPWRMLEILVAAPPARERYFDTLKSRPTSLDPLAAGMWERPSPSTSTTARSRVTAPGLQKSGVAKLRLGPPSTTATVLPIPSAAARSVRPSRSKSPARIATLLETG